MSQDTEHRIDVRQAVDEARSFLCGLLGEAEGAVEELRLEEVDFCDEEHAWLITLSFLRKLRDDTVEVNPFTTWDTPRENGKIFRREYKTVRIDGTSGEPRGMKMWTPP